MKTDNELIAEFMGFTCCDTGQDRFWNPPSQPQATINDWEYHTNHLDYFRTSWDWLMPVVEKIESLGYTVEIASSDYQIRKTGDTEAFIFHYGPDRPKIKAVYEAVVEFIKWYNQQEQ